MGTICCANSNDPYENYTPRELINKTITSNHSTQLKSHNNFIKISHVNVLFESKHLYLDQTSDKASKSFSDSLFPANLNSLTFIDPDSEAANDITPEEIAPFKSLIWLRPKEIFGNDNYKLYYTIDIDDIHQGILGNCYFLSSVSALAEFPERFNKIFIEKEVSKNGCYSVQFYINGKPKIVTIDDQFPCLLKNKKWAFSHAGNREIWVQILEKAWAKVCGSYASTIAGLPSEALSTLCEAPCVTYIHTRYQKDVIWKILLESDKKNYIICTNSTDRKDAEKQGIALSHAYTVISCYETKGKRLVKLRNPWGQFEWKGDYSDSSPLWTDELKKELGYKKENDGIFFMTFEDFIKFYPYTFSCKFEANFYYDYKKFKPAENTSYVVSKIILDKPTKISIGLHQKQVRFYRKVKGYRANYSRLLVAKYNKNDETYEFIGSDFSQNEKLYVSIDELQPGEYHIFGQVSWKYEEKCSFVISTYASSLAKIESVNIYDIPFDWLNQILTSFLKKNKKYNEILGDIRSLESLDDNHTGYHIVHFHNKGSKINLFSVTCCPNEHQTLITKHFGKNDENAHLIEFYLYPNQGKTLIFEIHDIYKAKLSLTNYETSIVHDCEIKEEKKLIISRYVDYFDKEIISNGIFFIEMKIKNSLYYVFFNHQSYDAKIKVNFEKLENIRNTRANNETDLIVKKNSFEYVSVDIIETLSPYDCQLSYSLF